MADTLIGPNDDILLPKLKEAQKTTAVRVIPAIGHKAGDVLDFGGLLGHAPIMPISRYSPAVMIHRGGRIPAPMQALKN